MRFNLFIIYCISSKPYFVICKKHPDSKSPLPKDITGLQSILYCMFYFITKTLQMSLIYFSSSFHLAVKQLILAKLLS